MDKNFFVVMKPLQAHEGGYSNHPSDPGGSTYRGVTQRTYDAYRKVRTLPTRDVRQMTAAEYTDIYKTFYWNPCGGPSLPSGVDYAVFDAAVNSGVRQSIKWLQRALKGQGLYQDGSIDGQFGVQTREAVMEADILQLIQDICNQRLWFLQKLETWPVFGKGWGRRVADVRRVSLVMAKNDMEPEEPDEPLPPPVHIAAEETAKAPSSSTKVTETAAGNVAAKTGGLGVVTVVLSVLEKSSEYISIFTGMPQWLIQYILIALIICAVVGIIGFAAVAIMDVIRRKRKGEDMEAP